MDVRFARKIPNLSMRCGTMMAWEDGTTTDGQRGRKGCELGKNWKT